MNYKKEIAPLPEGFADAISRTINKLQHMQEAPASRKSDRSDGDTKPQDISGEEEKVSADKKAPARKGDKSQGEAMASVKEETEALEEVRNIKIAKDGKDEKMVNKQELKTYLQMGWKEVKEEAELDEAGCISSSYKKEKKEEIDAVNPKAVKKKFDDRKDKDIDNDGDEDESDEYLHKRRKAISKALSKDESVKKPNASVDESAELEGLDEKFSPREIKMAIGIASDKRYAGGNMTGAVKAIEKIKKGLSSHPQVAAVLKRQNEGKMKTFDDLRAELAEGKAKNAAQQAAIAIAKKEKGELTEREDTAAQVARALKKMGFKRGAKETDITKKIPAVLKKMGLDKNIANDRDFLGDVLDDVMEMKEEMDPTDHVKEKDGKFCVYNADGSVAKEFDNKDDADQYAIDNHDKLMATAKKDVDENKKMDSAAMKRAMDAFKKRGGKIKKVAPGKAAGYHGKDDPGQDVHGMMDRPDTKGFNRKKKVKSMGK